MTTKTTEQIRDELAEKYTKSSIHKKDEYCEQGYYHPMRKGYLAGFDAAVEHLKDSEKLSLECEKCKKEGV